MLNDYTVSVVVPTYNRPEYLAILLNSITSQNHPVLEIIVINDNSDNKCENEYNKVIDYYSKKISLTYIYLNTSKGAQYARNLGLNISKAKWVAFVDDDDYWSSSKISNQILALRKKPNATMVYSGVIIVDNEGNEVGKKLPSINKNIKSSILSECFIPSPTIMVERDAIISIGGFDSKMPSCQDWDTWVNMIFNGCEITFSNHLDAYYRKHSYASIGKSDKAMLGYSLFYKKHIFKLFYSKSFFIAALKFFIKRPKYLF